MVRVNGWPRTVTRIRQFHQLPIQTALREVLLVFKSSFVAERTVNSALGPNPPSDGTIRVKTSVPRAKENLLLFELRDSIF
jgi:hypothetical protein